MIAVLAITPPGRSLAAALLRTSTAAATTADAATVVNIIAIAYLSVWMSCGLALLVGWMTIATPNLALASAAKSWLGLAVAAAYSYLGLHPNG